MFNSSCLSLQIISILCSESKVWFLAVKVSDLTLRSAAQGDRATSFRTGSSHRLLAAALEGLAPPPPSPQAAASGPRSPAAADGEGPVRICLLLAESQGPEPEGGYYLLGSTERCSEITVKRKETRLLMILSIKQFRLVKQKRDVITT